MPRGFAKRDKREPRPFSPQFWLLAGGTLIYLVGIQMCYPFQSIFLTETLGVSATATGLILGIPLFAMLPMQVIGGALCDRLGRRPMLLLGICGSIILCLGTGLVRSLPVLVAIITVEAGIGWAQYTTASNTVIADLTPPERRAGAFSILRIATGLGMTIGPALATPLIKLDPSFRVAFVAAALLCAVFAAVIIFLFRETRPPEARAASVLAVFRGYGHVLRDRRMLAFCAIAILTLYGFGQIFITLPIMLSDLHGVSPGMWSACLVVYGAASALLQYPVIRLLRGLDRMVLLALASVFLGLGMGAAAFVPWPGTLACLILMALGVVLLIPISATVVSHLAPAELRGRYMGAWTLVYIGGFSLGPLVGGAALDALGGRSAFAVIAVAALVGAGLFVLQRKKRPAETPAHGGVETEELLGDELRGERPEQVL